MSFEATIDYARNLDRNDPLKKFRKEFYFPKHQSKKAIYLCGNSLGLLSRNIKGAIARELKDWKNLAIHGYLHAKHPWMYYQDNFTRPLSKIMGCKESEVTVMNALTVNLHLLMTTFFRPTKEKFSILMESGAFPSDQYAIETQVKLHGLIPEQAIIEVAPEAGKKTISTAQILKAIHENKDTLALVLLGGINYYSGQLFDLKAITGAAHAHGILAGFDLAHVAGNVPMHLHDWDVDFAFWCSYKYLNGGPGAVGGLFIHERFAHDDQLQRLGGWWANDENTRFRMEKGFVPKKGAAGWSISTAQVFNMVCLKASLELIDRAGIENLRLKSVHLTGYLEFLVGKLTNLDLEIITPADPSQRGAQLSLFIKKDSKKLHQKMIEKGVVVDYREPGVIRVAPAPIFNSFKDVFRFYEILRKG